MTTPGDSCINQDISSVLSGAKEITAKLEFSTERHLPRDTLYYLSPGTFRHMHDDLARENETSGGKNRPVKYLKCAVSRLKTCKLECELLRAIQ